MVLEKLARFFRGILFWHARYITQSLYHIWGSAPEPCCTASSKLLSARIKHKSFSTHILLKRTIQKGGVRLTFFFIHIFIHVTRKQVRLHKRQVDRCWMHHRAVPNIHFIAEHCDEKSSDIKQNHEPRLNMKKRSETQTLRAGCSKAERRTAKI